MKTLLAGLACSAALMAGAAWAQPTVRDNTDQGSTVNPKPPASQTTTAPARTAKTGHTASQKSDQTAMSEPCRKQADERQLSGKARTDYLHRCRLENAPR